MGCFGWLEIAVCWPVLSSPMASVRQFQDSRMVSASWDRGNCGHDDGLSNIQLHTPLYGRVVWPWTTIIVSFLDFCFSLRRRLFHH